MRGRISETGIDVGAAAPSPLAIRPIISTLDSRRDRSLRTRPVLESSGADCHAVDLGLARSNPIPDNRNARQSGFSRADAREAGVQGEPGGTRAMGACEPGQGGNAAAISITFMCPGEPPRLSPTPVRAAAIAGRPDRRRRNHASGRDRPSAPRPDGASPDGPSTERTEVSDAGARGHARRMATRSSPGAIGRSGSRTSSGRTTSSRSLRNAIRLNRVTHAYLFCGTRGVGKTSMARIFAKCLNCVQGPTEEPCQACDICQAIAVGQDVDVIEIDGASNNGVEAGPRAPAERRAAAQPRRGSRSTTSTKSTCSRPAPSTPC